MNKDEFLSVEGRKKLSILSNLERYNNSIRIHKENVAEHSFYVAFYAMRLCKFFKIAPIYELIIVEKALIHDVHEIKLSDIPHNIKKENLGIEKTCLEFERKYNKKHFLSLEEGVEAMKDDKFLYFLPDFIVGMADVISVLMYSEQEMMIGNSYFNRVHTSAENRINQLIEKGKEANLINDEIANKIRLMILE